MHLQSGSWISRGTWGSPGHQRCLKRRPWSWDLKLGMHQPHKGSEEHISEEAACVQGPRDACRVEAQQHEAPCHGTTEGQAEGAGSRAEPRKSPRIRRDSGGSRDQFPDYSCCQRSCKAEGGQGLWVCLFVSKPL